MNTKSLAISLQKKFDSNLHRIIGEDLPILKKIKKHVIYSGGKRIRPFLHYLFCQFLQVTNKHWLDVACVAELIHGASLLHDDVVDKAEKRRGQPTVGHIYGNKQAILAGDYLLACGIQTLTKIGSPELLEIFSEVLKDLSKSELLQMEYEKNPKITKKIYDEIIYGKTASLFGACTEAAAVLAGSNRKERIIYREFGIRLGIFFQKKDDALDYFTPSDSSGKEFLKDFKNGLFTYPVLLLREKLNLIEKRALYKLYAKEAKTSEDQDHILTLMNKYKIQTILANEWEKEKLYLNQFLSKFPDSIEKQLFNEQLAKLS